MGTLNPKGYLSRKPTNQKRDPQNHEDNKVERMHHHLRLYPERQTQTEQIRLEVHHYRRRPQNEKRQE